MKQTRSARRAMRITVRYGLVVAFILASGWALLCVLLMSFQDKLIFVPQRGGVGKSPGGEVWLTAQDGVQIHGWYLTHPSATHTLLHLHGNAGNLESRRELLTQLRDLGLNVLAIDYRGYGNSGGVPNEAGLYADAAAAYAWLVEHGPAHRIVVYGESLGGGPASELALRRPVGGLILQSAFTSVADLAALQFAWFPVRLLLRTRFDNLARLPKIAAPKFFIHGRADTIVPFGMAQRLYQAARPPKQHLWLEHASHNDVFVVDGPSVLSAVRAFITTLGSS